MVLRWASNRVIVEPRSATKSRWRWLTLAVYWQEWRGGVYDGDSTSRDLLNDITFYDMDVRPPASWGQYLRFLLVAQDDDIEEKSDDKIKWVNLSSKISKVTRYWLMFWIFISKIGRSWRTNTMCKYSLWRSWVPRQSLLQIPCDEFPRDLVARMWGILLSEPDVSLVFTTRFVWIVAAHDAIKSTRVCFLQGY